MKKSLIFGIAAVMLFGCAAKNVNSYKTNGERVEVRPVPTGYGITGLGTIAAALAPKIIDFGASKLEAIFEEESKKYVAAYSGKHVGEDFYSSDQTLDLSYDKIEIRRYIIEKKNNTDQEILASSLTLGFDTNREGTLLTIKPLQVVVYKTKAKLKSNDNDLDITLNFTLNGYWNNKNQEVKSKELADVTMVLKKIRLGDTYNLKVDEDGANFYLENEAGIKSNYNVMGDWFAPVPYSVDQNGDRSKHAQGNFSFAITVTEVDDYGQKIARFGKDINDSKAIWIALAKELME